MFWIFNYWIHLYNYLKGENPNKNLTNKVDDVVYAWGNSIVEPSELRNLITSPLCFGKNINGSPKHPLYLSSKSKLIKFR